MEIRHILNLTRKQAAEYLSQGFKMKHKYFSEGEYIYLKKDKVLTEDGYDFTNSFWSNDFFETGWRFSEIQDS